MAISQKKDLYYGVVRYLLGAAMLPYAISKILCTQFVVLPFSYNQIPLEELNGRRLTWAFMGYSHWFEILLGVFEFFPSLLLFFRKTSLLGAILLFPMTLGVLLINYALDLWSTTQHIATYLMVLNCLIFAFEWQKLKSTFLVIVSAAAKVKHLLPEALINTALIVALLYYFSSDLLPYRSEKNCLTGDWFNKHPNEWNLASEKIGDSTLPCHSVRSYFGPYGIYSEINDSVKGDKGSIDYKIDEKRHSVTMHSFDRAEDHLYTLIGDFGYAMLNDSTLKISDANNEAHTWIFKRRVMKPNQADVKTR